MRLRKRGKPGIGPQFRAWAGRKTEDPMPRLLESSRSSAMRTRRLRPTSPSSLASHQAVAGTWCACPSASTGRRTFASAMQRTRFTFFRAEQVFAIRVLDRLGAHAAQGRVSREFDRRLGEAPAGSFVTRHLALQGIDDELAERRTALDRCDLGAAKEVIGEFERCSHGRDPHLCLPAFTVAGRDLPGRKRE